jgi:hypothetical protein
MIYCQPYIRITRSVEVIEQKVTEKEYNLYLYEDKIISDSHHFPLETVHHTSYKPFSANGGLLYLHTNQGVFTYQVKENPKSFMLAFNTLK